jgi:hypothetical protein
MCIQLDGMIRVFFSARLFRSRRVGVKLAIARAGDSWKV